MGKLVQFDKRTGQTRTRPAIAGKAEIYLFTGVRYERDGTPVPGKPQNAAKPKRKRG